MQEESANKSGKQQEVHLFPKLNKMRVFSQRKCRVRCVGGMLDKRCVNVQRVGEMYDHEDCVGVRKMI